MKVKPKDIQVNLPAVLMFDDQDSVAHQAAAVNTFIHGKVKIKYEELGMLGGQYVGIFYIQRNDEFTELRESFMTLIENEEVENANASDEAWLEAPLTDEEKKAIDDAELEEGIPW
jgi:hypothetical protein